MKNPLPQPLVDRLTKQFGPGAVASMLKAFEKSRLPTLRVNTLKSTDEEVMNVLRDESIAETAAVHGLLLKWIRGREIR